MVRPVTTVHVIPNLPPSLERLRELAYNLRWSWDHETIALFRRLNRSLWEETGHNPILMLGRIDQSQLAQAAADEAFLAHLDRVCASYDRYMSGGNSTWYAKHHGKPITDQPTIAYFSMEFGLTECLRNYSGGLGILSGDHLKSASDLGVPLVGLGILYQEGYFSQYLNSDGFQQEAYPINDYANQPVTLMRGDDGEPLLVKVPLPGRYLHAQIWRVQVGRVPLFLLDSNISANSLPEDRDLTDRLYGGDRRQRIRQEILMGIGGIQALHLLGLDPTVFHMNEGHSAFMGLERIRLLMTQNRQLSFQQAWEICRSSSIFTTHTPVPAGLERFGFDLIDEHFAYLWQELGLSRDQFLDLGRENMGGYELFSMAVLALNLSSAANGVAKLHGDVSRDLWQWMYPNLPVEEIPIQHVTNGIHVETWVSREMGELFDRYFDPSWREDPTNPNTWWDIDKIPDAELWRTHERRRERLVAASRERLKQQLINRGVPQTEIEIADEVLNPEALTIGFARRFATYKRATLILQDKERLHRLLNHATRPVQLIFAGKAHPHDIPGKELIREIVSTARMSEFRHRIVFLENYDMAIGRLLVQGVDVWLNNPRRPEEASGTSGMKVIYNGGLNASTLDGWWAEAYDPSVGWEIGKGEEYPPEQHALQNKIEADALYTLLERDIVPIFYERTRDGLPREWIAMVKNSIRKLAPFFNTNRMLMEYTDQYYIPALARHHRLTSPDFTRGVALAEWRKMLDRAWGRVRVVRVETSGNSLKIGSEQEVHAWVDLGELKPSDVTVQLYYGNLNTHGAIDHGETVDMNVLVQNGTVHEFAGKIGYRTTGQFGVSVRVLPSHEDLPTQFQRGLVRWA
jgi:starch phosphorylase